MVPADSLVSSWRRVAPHALPAPSHKREVSLEGGMNANRPNAWGDFIECACKSELP